MGSAGKLTPVGKSFFPDRSQQRNKISLLGIALIAVIGASAFAQIKLNAWNQPFYDALSRKDLGAVFFPARGLCLHRLWTFNPQGSRDLVQPKDEAQAA
jgi:ABC-type uncharacterized transport system fused permease/ATPase subunit